MGPWWAPFSLSGKLVTLLRGYDRFMNYPINTGKKYSL